MFPKSATAALLGAAVLPLTVAQFSTSSSFQAPPLVEGDLAVWGIFAFFFLIQAVVCLCSLIVASGHRITYAILLLFTILSVILCCVNVAWTVVGNMTFVNTPDQVFPPLASISALFFGWTGALLYLAITCVLWDRRAAINAATEKRLGSLQVAHSVIRGVLFVIVLVAGTVYGALFAKYYQALYPANTLFPSDQVALINRFNAEQRAFYVFNAFLSVTAIDVVASSTILYNFMRREKVNDKMTKILLFAISPLYTLMAIISIVFEILFSPVGNSTLSTQDAIESATLANDLLSNIFFYAIPMILIVMGLRRSNWTVEGGKLHNGVYGIQQGWTPQQAYGQPQHYPSEPQPQYYQQHYAPQQQYTPQQSPMQHALGVVPEKEQG